MVQKLSKLSKLVKFFRFSWITWACGFGLAFLAELVRYKHLNLYDWSVAAVYSVIVACVVTVPVWLLTPFLIKYKKFPIWLVPVVLVPTFFASIAAFWITLPLPRDSWEIIQGAPEKLAKFVELDPFWFFGGGVYAMGESGRTYLFSCSEKCEWKSEALPEPAKEGRPSMGGCGRSLADATLTPLAFFKVKEKIAATHCGPDYSTTSIFVLGEDGVAWVWLTGESIYDSMDQELHHKVGGAIVGVVSCIFLLRTTRKKAPELY